MLGKVRDTAFENIVSAIAGAGRRREITRRHHTISHEYIKANVLSISATMQTQTAQTPNKDSGIQIFWT
jgi:hypothetical protein